MSADDWQTEQTRFLIAVHPVRIRYAGITWRKTREEDVPAGYDAWEAIKSAPWIRSRDIGGAL